MKARSRLELMRATDDELLRRLDELAGMADDSSAEGVAIVRELHTRERAAERMRTLRTLTPTVPSPLTVAERREQDAAEGKRALFNLCLWLVFVVGIALTLFTFIRRTQ